MIKGLVIGFFIGFGISLALEFNRMNSKSREPFGEFPWETASPWFVRKPRKDHFHYYPKYQRSIS